MIITSLDWRGEGVRNFFVNLLGFRWFFFNRAYEIFLDWSCRGTKHIWELEENSPDKVCRVDNLMSRLLCDDDLVAFSTNTLCRTTGHPKWFGQKWFLFVTDLSFSYFALEIYQKFCRNFLDCSRFLISHDMMILSFLSTCDAPIPHLALIRSHCVLIIPQPVSVSYKSASKNLSKVEEKDGKYV